MTQNIDKILSHIGEYHGLTVLWKGIGVKRSECGLPPEHTLHCNAFCCQVKNDRARLKLCSENDNIHMLSEAEKIKAPFIRRCHAGVSELVVPLLVDEQCSEVLLAGIFREPQTECIYPDSENLFKKLPEIQSGELTGTGELLFELAPVLLAYRESLQRRKLLGVVKDYRIVKAIEIIRAGYAGKMALTDLAAKLHLSASRFIHLFKEETGVTFSEYLKNIRLEKATELMRSTDYEIYQVMENCGFNDQSYFCTQFKKYTGYPPLTYRRIYEEKNDI